MSECAFGPHAALAKKPEMLMYNMYTPLSELFAALSADQIHHSAPAPAHSCPHVNAPLSGVDGGGGGGEGKSTCVPASEMIEVDVATACLPQSVVLLLQKHSMFMLPPNPAIHNGYCVRRLDSGAIRATSLSQYLHLTAFGIDWLFLLLHHKHCRMHMIRDSKLPSTLHFIMKLLNLI